ncbi:MAG TPA: hydrogenase maturation protease [bacterium]|nr:hydrogenase maturation protease [bacterium]HMW37297.1 hydrogenase maturation protease [bacterium]HMY35699.1 hydrogenase maturation protease [bacterium]HMZ04694.1 hydrogenase maturation protease [bacterium]HNB09752.1 hydrogenase maturation protease [bacterium]
MKEYNVITTSASVVVIGIGNEYRRDDRAGIEVVRAIADMCLPDVCVIEHNGDGSSLQDVWSDARWVIIIDTVCSDNIPGTIYRLRANADIIPGNFFNYSSHAYSISEAIELAKALHHPVPEVIIYGIEGANFEFGEELTPNVREKIGDLITRVCQDIERIMQESPVSA